MTAADVRAELHRILDAHGQRLTRLRAGNETLQQVQRSMQETFAAHDAVLVSLDVLRALSGLQERADGRLSVLGGRPRVSRSDVNVAIAGGGR